MICKNFILISVIFILFLNIYSQKEKFTSISSKRTGIVSMVTKQPDFHFWIDYHLNILGIDHIFLRVEDAPEYKNIIDKYPNRITASYHKKKNINTKNNYHTIMDRQKDHVNKTCKKAKKLNIDYLFHCDSDELIHVISPKCNLKENFKKYLSNIEDIDSCIKCIHFKNFEAVFPKLSEKCFTTNKFIDCKKGGCLSYANGKSCGLVKKGAIFRGPHYFSGKVYNMPDNKIVILHYDSCTFKQWFTKFNLLKYTDKKKLNKIPFPFYKKSIEHVNKCKDEDELCKSFYKKKKIIPYKKSINLKYFNPYMSN